MALTRPPGPDEDGHDMDDEPEDPTVRQCDVQARWDALADTARQMASTDDAEGFHAAWNAMRQVGRGIDRQQILDLMHVPDDAGEHAEALRGILARIPDGWGRWISCSRGWYSLLVELDEQLRTLLPNYELHQVKEKFGGLRYYWEPGEKIHDPDDPEPPTPGRECSEAESEQYKQAYESWCERLDVYQQKPEGQRRSADLLRRVKLAEQLVDAAERCSGVTCELCGAAGRLHHTPARRYKTLCPGCADEAGYVPHRGSDAR
jgi:hypothetical protein